MRDIYGDERVTRGCTTSHEHLPLICNQMKNSAANNNVNNIVNNQIDSENDFIDTPSSSGSGPSKRHAQSQAGVYDIQCCSGDYCNNGSFPILPNVIKFGMLFLIFKRLYYNW